MLSLINKVKLAISAPDNEATVPRVHNNNNTLDSTFLAKQITCSYYYKSHHPCTGNVDKVYCMWVCIDTHNTTYQHTSEKHLLLNTYACMRTYVNMPCIYKLSVSTRKAYNHMDEFVVSLIHYYLFDQLASIIAYIYMILLARTHQHFSHQHTEE